VNPDPTGEPILTARPIEPGSVTPPTPDLARSLSPREALIEAAFTLFILFTPTVLRSLLLRTDILDQAEKTGISPYWSVLLSGAMAMALVAFILHKDRHSFQSLGLSFKGFWTEAFIAGVVLVGIYLLQYAVVVAMSKWNPEWTAKMGQQRFETANKFPPLSPQYLLLFTVFVGFYEELLFRGFLISRLKTAMKSVWLALIVSSVIFAVIHSYQDRLAMLQIFFIAMILGGLFIIRGNLIGPMLVHAGFDFVSLFLVFYLSKLTPEQLRELKNMVPKMCVLVFGG